ncbi:hypothetical protein D7X94_10430 [Acutalibacter sp. 1XD8-33]|uniref:hypothetical protein n=1 Tax=Acutalibacter sp. 1XD8-33 TaxID=2320081 RepID=UPI000EA1E7CF|nr:hypothetical protein [Acutalibacter sp. 1XD8-33]RKJ39832.1 hypothetical protein D7X94_10430 [Acutalibacter sp. 1XD8-33]
MSGRGVNSNIAPLSIFNDTVDFLRPFAEESMETLTAWTEKSISTEKAIYEELQEVAGKWREQAAVTLLLQKAVECLITPQVQHTGNVWEKDSDIWPRLLAQRRGSEKR